jgi:hypothetical protein
MDEECSKTQGLRSSARDRELSRAQYVMIFRKIVKAMVADYDEEEATMTAEEEWENDRRGRETLSAALFMDGLFECMTALKRAKPPSARALTQGPKGQQPTEAAATRSATTR